MDIQNEPSEILRPSYDNLWTLVSLWDEMGIDHQQRENRVRRAQEMVTSLVQDLIAEEMETKRMVIKRIEELQRRIKDLSAELGAPVEACPAEQTSMVKQEKYLHSRVTLLREEKQKRMARFETLRARDVDLSERLGRPALDLNRPDGRLPNEVEIDALADRVAALSTEVEIRLAEVRQLRADLLACLRALEVDRPDGLDAWPLLADDALMETRLPLTEPALGQLRATVQRYRERRDTAESHCQRLMAAIEQLWERLGTEPSDRRLFRAQLPASKAASLHVLEAEVSRLEEMKRANMERFVGECKAELRLWWERCYISEEEQDERAVFDPDENVADILEKLEHELARLKQYYEDNKPAFLKVCDWNLAFEKLKITEMRMKDPSVLSNRGGVLLKYEKTRRATLRQMKGLETGLGAFPAARAEGRPVLGYLEARRRAYEEEKENEKRERQEKHSSLLHREMRFGSKPVVTPGKKRVLSTTQRHQLTAASTTAVNVTGVGAAETSVHPKLRKIDTAAEQFRRKRVSLAKRRSIAQSRGGPAAGVRPIPMDIRSLARTPRKADVTCATTYSEFAQDVNSNPQSRSSTGLSSAASSKPASQRTFKR